MLFSPLEEIDGLRCPYFFLFLCLLSPERLGKILGFFYVHLFYFSSLSPFPSLNRRARLTPGLLSLWFRLRNHRTLFDPFFLCVRQLDLPPFYVLLHGVFNSLFSPVKFSDIPFPWYFFLTENGLPSPVLNNCTEVGLHLPR